MQYLKARLTRALIDHFGGDDRRIDHALAVTRWAERILEIEGGDEAVALAVGLLHDVGIKKAEQIHGYNTGKMQEEYGPPIARNILQKIGLPEAQINEACEIIANHHTPEGIPGPNFPILWDADMIVNLGDEMPDTDHEKLESIIEKSFRTKAGKTLARKTLIHKNEVD